MVDMSAPTEIIIDTLVLRGVSEADAQAITESFARHLRVMSDGTLEPEEQPRPHMHGAEAHGYRLALSVARAIEQVRRP